MTGRPGQHARHPSPRFPAGRPPIVDSDLAPGTLRPLNFARAVAASGFAHHNSTVLVATR